MRIKRETERFELIFEKELEEFLKHQKLYDKLTRGDIKCAFCSETITFENLGAIMVKKGKLIFICSRIECLDKLNR